MSVNIHVETASGWVAGNSARKGSTSSAATSRLPKICVVRGALRASVKVNGWLISLSPSL